MPFSAEDVSNYMKSERAKMAEADLSKNNDNLQLVPTKRLKEVRSYLLTKLVLGNFGRNSEVTTFPVL